MWLGNFPVDCVFFLLFLITILGKDPSTDLQVASRVTPSLLRASRTEMFLVLVWEGMSLKVMLDLL